MTLLSWGWCDTQQIGSACIGPLFLSRNLQKQSLGNQATGWHGHPWVAFKKPDNPQPSHHWLRHSPFLFLFPLLVTAGFCLGHLLLYLFYLLGSVPGMWPASQRAAWFVDIQRNGYSLLSYYAFRSINFQTLQLQSWAMHFYFLFYSHFWIWVALGR